MLVNFGGKVIEITKEEWNKFINAKPDKEFLDRCRKNSKMFKRIKII